MFDCLIIGGGVIGLSLAYELAHRGRRICLLDREVAGRSASWAGAGMLPPASATSIEPVEQFACFSNQLHVEWASRLQQETGVDTGYRASGAIYLATTDAAAAELKVTTIKANHAGIAFNALSHHDIRQLEPAIDPEQLLAAYHVPGECQLRNPRYLKALQAACHKLGVTIIEHAAAENFEIRSNVIESVQTSGSTYHAEQFCIATGAWSGAIARQLGLKLTIKPIRGQIALLQLPQPPLTRILNEGPRYLVPRDDGRVLVGSTMEDVGFDTSTTSDAIDELVHFARRLAPPLAHARLEASWAGLRPASADGQPYLGQLPELKNCFVAAGHTRSGLHLSPATAVVMARLMSGEAAGFDLSPFQLNR